jgi:hypothetical protein
MDRTSQLQRRPVHFGQRARAIMTGPEPNFLEGLERRLVDGYARIEEARQRGQDVTAWEEFWIDLLHQYEAAVDGLPEAA